MSDRHTSLVGSLVRQVKARNKAKVDSRVKSRVRLTAILKMEQLESRWVPALITWDGGAGTLNWADQNNWSGNTLPTANDEALIPDLAGNVTISIASTQTVQSLTSSETIQISSGTFSLTSTTKESSFKQGLKFTGGSLLVSGNANVSSNSTFSGTLGGSGSIRNDGNMVFSNPTFKGEVQFRNAGTVDWNTPQINMYNNATLINQPGATFNASRDFNYPDASIYNSDSIGTKSFINQGTFVNKGSYSPSIRIPFTQTDTGTIDVQKSSLYLTSGGSLSGSANIANGTTLNLSSGSFSVPANATFTTSGLGTFSLTSTYTGDGTLISSGVSTISGTINGNASYVNKGNATLNGTFSTTGTLRNDGSMVLSNPTFKGEVQFRNAGTVDLNTSSINMYNNATLINQPGATFNAFIDYHYPNFFIFNSDSIDTKSFINQGTFVNKGSYSLSIQIPFTQTDTGTIDVQQSSLNLSSGGSLSGSAKIASGSSLSLNGGTFNSPANSSFSMIGAGSFAMSGGSTVMNLQGQANLTNFAQSSGTLQGNGTIRTTGSASSLSGTITGNVSYINSGLATLGGTFSTTGTLRNDGNMVFSNPTFKGEVQFRNAGTVDWNTPQINMYNNATLINQPGATFNASRDFNYPDASIYNSDSIGTKSFINQGTFVNKGSYSPSIRIPFTQTDTGTIDVQKSSLYLTSGGSLSGSANIANGTTLNLSSGSFSVPANATFTTSGLGTFSLPSTYTGDGTLISSGVSTISGTINGNASYVNKGNATLNGTFSTTGLLRNDGNMVLSWPTFKGEVQFRNAGTVDWKSSYIFMYNNATLINQPGATFNALVSGYSIVNYDNTGVKSFINQGTFVQNGDSSTTIAIPFTQTDTGTIDVQQSSLSLSSLTNYNATTGTLSNGTYKLSGGTLNVASANFTKLEANVVLGSGSLTNLNLSLIAPNGSLTLTNGRGYNFGSSPGLTNAGRVVIGENSNSSVSGKILNTNTGQIEVLNNATLNYAGVYNQAIGRTLLRNGTLVATSVNIAGGSIDGDGSIKGSTTVNGTISVGSGSRALNITGNLLLTANALTSLQIGGPPFSSKNDVINVTGTAALAGQIRANFTDGYVPSQADRFDLIKYGSKTGGFNQVETLNLPSTTLVKSAAEANRFSLITNTLSQLVYISGSGQTATVGTSFAFPLKLRVNDDAGNPMPGVTVAFATPASGATGSFAGGVITAITGADGVATSPSLTANTVSGTYQISATVGDLTPVNFSMTNASGAATSLLVSSGSGQSVQVNTTFTDPLKVIVKDIYGNPVAGTTVTFNAPAIGASASFASGITTAQTGADGIATSTVLIAKTVAGSYQIDASAGSLTPVKFSLTNLTGPAAKVNYISGGGQSAVVTTSFDSVLRATVTDAYGNPVGGKTVAFAAPGGGASASFAGGTTTAVSAADGTVESVAITSNSVAGTYQIIASSSGLSSTSFSMTNLSGAATGISYVSGSGQSTKVNSAYGNQLKAKVTDAFGNPVGGSTVNFAAPASGASLGFAGGATTGVSGADGIATSAVMTANTIAGSFIVTASAAGLSDAPQFHLNNLIEEPASIGGNSGDNQSATISTNFTQVLEVVVKDVYNNAVPGVSVTFAAPGSGVTGTFEGATTVITNTAGIATSPVFKANTVAGTYQVTASVAGLAPFSFTLTNKAGAPTSVTYVSGSGQYASLDTNYLNSLKALVRDAFGNPVAGATVSFSVPGSGASVAFAGEVATAVTDAQGVATSAVMKATGAAGAFVVTTSVAGVSSPASFNLQNTTGPIVLSLTPTGLTNQNVSVLRAVFSEPMNLATFTGEDVKITLPGGGTIPFANISVAAVAGTGNTTFDISISEQSGDGKYDVEVGPAIAGVAGVSMTVAKTQSFTIDKTAPTVQSTDPSAEKNTTVSSLDITFSETLRAGTLSAADIVLKDPAGNVIPVGEPVLVSGNTYRFAFAQQRGNGVYTVKVGPNVLDLAGNAMVAAADRSFTVSLADLGFSGAVTTSVNTAKFGDSLDVSWALKNLGTAATAGAWTDRVYLSTDNTYSANDILLKSVVQNAGALAPNGQRATTTPVTLPLQAGQAAGNYYLIVRSDADNALIESNEANNVAASASLTITVPPLPDLKTLGVTAPASALPGSKVNLAWQVTNAGAVAAAGDWVERVYLSKDNAIGGDLLLAAFGRTGQAIAAGASVNRAEQVQLPANLDPGDWYFVVEVDSANAVAESDEGNNLAISPTLSNVPVLLTLTANAQSVREDGAAITGRVTRSGNVGQALVVSLSSSNTGEATVPPTVTIPAGFLWAEFPITPVQDNVLDGDKQVSITGRVLDGGGQPVAGYADGSVQVSVLDSASPTLSLQLLTTTVREGNSVTGRLTRSAATVGSAVVVTLEANFANQLAIPATVTIPAGSVSADFTVMGLLDEKVEISRVIQITASGPAVATANLTLTDANDASLVVTTSVPSVQENALGVAAIGTVTRPVAANRPQLVKLTADAGRLLVPAFVTIPAGARSAQFQIATVDNTISGDTTGVVIQALPVDAVDGTSTVAPGGQATLTVVDDDAAGLVVTIKDILISEVDNISSSIPAAIGVVRRNSADTSQQLTVLLSSSNTGEARVNASVTIEANASSANFPIYSVWDGVPDGTKQVTITASAPGMNSGSAMISVTDIDKPDLRVPGVSGPGAGYTGQPVSISYNIFNQGPIATPGGFTDRIYLSDDAILDLAKDTLVATRVRATALGGQTDDFVNSFGLTLPVDKVGKYYFLVQTDALKQVDEVFEENNVGYAAQPTVISAAYSATVSASVAQAAMGTPVVLSGKAIAAAAGISVAGVPVSVVVTQERSSIRRVLKATTDSQGNYSVTFTPFASEAGVYRVAAQHPAISADVTQATFKLLGMSVQPDAIGTHVTEGQTATGTFDVKNLTDVPLTGMAWTVVGAPANLEVTVTPPSLATLAGDGSASFSYSIKALNTSVQAANFTIRLSSAEGAVLDVPATVRVDALTALLQGPAVVKSPMVRNTLRTVEFTVTNPSGLATGPIRMLMPAGVTWLSVANASVINGVPLLPSVPANGSATVSLLLNPGASLALGSYTGTFVMVPESGPSLKVNYQFESVSVATGDLVVKVYDELVNLDSGLPLAVAGAKVELLNVFTGEVIRTATASAEGAASFTQVTDGYYNLRVSADNHDSNLGTVEVKAGVASDQIVVLRSRQVTYNWSVVPVPYEDRYQVQIESLFTTNVPAPVITISPGVIDLADPKFADGYEQVNFTITNHGLVAAKDMTFTFDTMGSTLWKITPLVEDIGQLAARSEITVPVIVQMIGDPNICSNINSFSGVLAWDVVSFDRKIPFQIPIPVLNADDCSAPNTWEPVFAGGGGSFAGGGGSFDGVLYPIAIPPTFNFITPIEVDAAVKLHLDQTAVMTRTAFDATLEIGNNLNVPLDGLQVQIMVTAAETGEVVSDRFAIGAAALSNITVDASGLWSVPAKSAGKSTWKLLPTDLAAPLKDTQYNVGGTFSYVVNGQRVVTPMKPALITVKPDAALQVTYFHQVDVYADDPWTPELEPSVPYDLGVMVTNVGAGTANSLTITSGQPKIVENEKGLLIDFQIVGAQVNNQPVEKSLTVNFGDVASGTTEVGRWQLTSTLQGQFTSYEATFQHLTGLGDPRTSLIKSVKILPLIHTVKDTRAGADTLPDFLTDEVADTYHTPDTIHLSNGQILPVGLGTATSTPSAPRAGAMSVNFNANMPAGFGYLRLIDPNTDTGAYKLVGVKRADGSFIAVGDNVWTTNRTFTVPFQRPIVENSIHVLDAVGSASYSLVYASTDVTGPTVTGISAVLPNPAATAIASLDVTFSEPIDPTSFTTADLVLKVNVVAVSTTGLSITAVDSTNTVFHVTGLTSLTSADAQYDFSVNTPGMTDIWGNAGTGTAARSWVKAASSLAIANVAGVPSGPTRTAPFKVTVQFNRAVQASSFDYSDMTLTRNGGANLITSSSGVSFNVLDSQTVDFYLPVDLTAIDGDYALTIAATGVKDNLGQAGVGIFSQTWKLDKTAPVLLPLEPIATNPRNTVVQSAKVTFSEPIDPSSFTTANVRLLRGTSSTNVLDFRFSITQLSPTEFLLDGINWPQGTEGDYTLSVDSAGVLDPARNLATGAQSVTWRLDLTAPLPPTNFAITPDLGISNTDMITSTGEVALLGKASEAWGRVKFEDDQTGKDLGYTVLNGSRDYIFPTVLGTGMNKIKVIEVDLAGNFSDPAFMYVKIDQTSAAANTMTQEPRTNTTQLVHYVDVTFTKPINVATFTVSALGLARDGVPVDLSSASITSITATTYRIGNLGGPAATTGLFSLSLNTASIYDQAGNAGAGLLKSQWQVQVPAVLAIVTGDSQSTSVGNSFNIPLNVRLTDTAGNPIPGILVTFAAPGSGASALFAGGLTTATTDANGEAASAALKANSVIGTYSVTATAAGLAPTIFTLTNATPELASFTVQKGSVGRSFVRYVDLAFNTTATLGDIVASIGTGSPRIRMTNTGLDGSANVNYSLANKIAAVDAVLALDFGAQGIGGERNSATGDGSYLIEMDLDGNGSFETSRRFYRLLGDVNGDKVVDGLDANIVAVNIGATGSNVAADINGDGVVNAADTLLVRRQKGRRITI